MKTVKILLNTNQDEEVSSKLKIFYPTIIQRKIDKGTWLLYCKETFKPFGAEFIFQTDNHILYDETLKIFQILEVEVLVDLPDDLKEYQLIYGMKEGADVGLYNS